MDDFGRSPGRGRRTLSQSNHHTAKALSHTDGFPTLRAHACAASPRTDREMRARPLAETEAPERPFGRAESWLGETDRSILGRRERRGVRLGVEVGPADRNLGTRSSARAGFAPTHRPAAVSHRPLSRYLTSRSGACSDLKLRSQGRFISGWKTARLQPTVANRPAANSGLNCSLSLSYKLRPLSKVALRLTPRVEIHSNNRLLSTLCPDVDWRLSAQRWNRKVQPQIVSK